MKILKNSRAGRPRNLEAISVLSVFDDMPLFWMSQCLTQKHFGRRDKRNAVA